MAKTANKNKSTITLNKVTNTTLPAKPAKAAAYKAPTAGSLTTNAPIANKAKPIANKAKPIANKAKPTPQQFINVKHGANNNKALIAFWASQIANSGLKNKTTIAIIWHMFNAYNSNTLIAALPVQHTACSILYYNNASGAVVNDANNGKHYACSHFKGIYTNNLKATHIKAVASVILQAPMLTQLVNMWAGVTNNKTFNAGKFIAHLAKLSV